MSYLDFIDYYEYIYSALWEQNKRKSARVWGWKCSIRGCGKWAKAFHHLTYQYIGTRDDWRYIRPVCKVHHFLCHWKWFGLVKIPLTKEALTKRYNQVSRNRVGRLRPSDIIDWFISAYSPG